MRWRAAIALAAVLAAGCNQAGPSADPFAPRLLPSTRVPPPATGAAGGAGDGSYYTAPAPGPLPTPAPAAMPPGGSGSLDSPANGPFRASPPGNGSFTPNQSPGASISPKTHPRTRGRLVDRSVVPASHVAPVAATAADDEEEDDEEVDGEYEDSEEEGAHRLQPTSARFGRAPSSRGAVDIMDLPAVRR